MDKNQLTNLIIRPTLKKLNMWSKSAENLLLGTCSHESNLGYYIKQIEGPALGIYQMEPKTFRDIIDNYICFKPMLKAQLEFVLKCACEKWENQSLMTNLVFSTAFCRVHYWRVAEELPAADDIEGLAAYWKKYYNTEKGKGTTKEFVNNYKKYLEE